MAGIPQSFMIYKEEFRKEKIEKERLEKEYNAKLSQLKKELSLLHEKISAQETMMKTMVDYAVKIESQLDSLSQQVEGDKNKSYH